MPSVTWLRTRRPRADASLTLVCLPHAGGGPTAFHEWPRHTRRMEIVAAQLPGRAGRISEPALTDLGAVVDGLDRALRGHDRPFALFGHSMGALLAFELARQVAGRGDHRLRALVVAACRAPHVSPPTPVHNLPADELIGELAGLGGFHPEVLEDPELVSLVLPTLRSDLAMADAYRYVDGPPLPCALHVHCGDRDTELGPCRAYEWQRHAAAEFSATVHKGGHFFPVHRPGPVVRRIEHALLGTAGGALQ